VDLGESKRGYRGIRAFTISFGLERSMALLLDSRHRMECVAKYVPIDYRFASLKNNYHPEF